MSFEFPNYYNTQDRQLYDKLWSESATRELTKAEHDFVCDMYHQEEFMSGLDGRDEYEDYTLGDDDDE